MVERSGFEPLKAIASRFTVCPVWPLRYLSPVWAGVPAVARKRNCQPSASLRSAMAVSLRGTLRSERRLERAMGIEPTSPAWKAGALPLCYARAMRRQATTAPPPASSRDPARRQHRVGHAVKNLLVGTANRRQHAAELRRVANHEIIRAQADAPLKGPYFVRPEIEVRGFDEPGFLEPLQNEWMLRVTRQCPLDRLGPFLG